MYSRFQHFEQTECRTIKKTESDELQDIIRLIDNIRNGQAEPSQELSIVSRTLQLIRLIKTQREEANITELAFLLQACRGKFEPSVIISVSLLL